MRFSVSDVEVFASALRLQASGGRVRELHTEFGLKLIVDGDLLCPDGRPRRLRSVWLVQGASRIRFVTAYPQEALDADR